MSRWPARLVATSSRCCYAKFKDGLHKYLATSTSAQKSLAALIAWNQANAARAMPLFGQELFERAQSKGPLTDKAYVDALAAIRRRVGPDGLLGAIEREKLEPLSRSVPGPAWRMDGPRGDRAGLTGGYGAAAIAGTPSITIPIGDSRGCHSASRSWGLRSASRN